jgi:hypothetical protein
MDVLMWSNFLRNFIPIGQVGAECVSSLEKFNFRGSVTHGEGRFVGSIVPDVKFLASAIDVDGEVLVLRNAHRPHKADMSDFDVVDSCQVLVPL